MKKLLLITVLIICALIMVWVGTVLYVTMLTDSHAEEFTNFETLEFDYLHSWEGVPKIRVLSYLDNCAIVYFCNSTGGEKAKFIKSTSGWVYCDTLALWSSTGSGDDYFVWPYFKDWVF